MGSYYLMDIELQFCRLEFWRCRVEMVAQHQMHLIPLNCTLKDGYGSKLYVIHILPQLNFKSWDYRNCPFCSKFCISLHTREEVLLKTATDVKQEIGPSTRDHSPCHPAALHKHNFFSNPWSQLSLTTVLQNQQSGITARVTEEESGSQGPRALS